MYKSFSVATILMLVAVIWTPSTALGQSFGGAVASSGGDVFVGYTANTNKSGVIHVYRNLGENWEEVAKLSASDADGNDDRFGRALFTSEDQLFAGATTRKNSVGGVYVFDRDKASNSWGESALLVPNDAREGESLGRSIAVSNGRMLIGAAGADSSRGKVYTYERDSYGKWNESASFSPDGLEPNDLFGLNVVSSGDLALVTAFRQGGPDRLPQVHAFRFVDGAWVSEGTLETGVHTAQSIYGLSVAMTDNRAFVGAQNHDNRGGVFVFDYDKSSNKWVYDGLLFASAEDGQVGFGSSVAVEAETLYVGAPGVDNNAGRIYTYSTTVEPMASPVVEVSAAGELTGIGGAIVVAGDLLLAGSPGADFGLGRAGIYSWSDSGEWNLVKEVFTPIESLAAVRGDQVRCEEGEAAGFGCEKVDLLSFMPVAELGGGRGVRTNDVWGWTDPETDKEYALVGRMDGTSFVDISDPYNPVLIGTLPKTEGTQSNSWRDIKVYKDHAYVVADGAGEHGMQIFDLRQLRNVTDAPRTFEATGHYDKIASAHNIVINEDTGFAYAVGSNSGGETCGGGSHMIDIRDPQNPTFAGCFAHEGTGRTGTGYTHDAQCVTYSGPDDRYSGREICFGSNETALSIADVTDKDNTRTLSSAAYPNVGYAHQGWLTEDQQYFLLNDELDEISQLTDGTRTLIWDVSDLEDPQLIKEHVSEVKSSDHNLYV
ncbi:MAG: choice-of-anchor B family protein, partial [Rhodothermales bacterium]|nr:choice-of-anchor B family protein [Rhodothermales bacterium]